MKATGGAAAYDDVKRDDVTNNNSIDTCDNVKHRLIDFTEIGSDGSENGGKGDDNNNEDEIIASLTTIGNNRTVRSLKRVLGKIWRRHRGNALITEYDPSYKVAYLGNVLTGWAKGEFC